jgi:DNA replication and repair protein RecF
MDGLFRDAAAARRRFLDRLVYAFDPGHARAVGAYETAMAERNRLLAAGAADPAWLAGLEEAMARHGMAIAAARRALAARLSGRAVPPFAAATLAVACPVGALLDDRPALAAEAAFRDRLAAARAGDAAAGLARDGPHRADLVVAHAAKAMPAALCSTGEQKSLLVAIVLAHAALIAEARGTAPILLLDEPATHLDPAHRSALFAALAALPAQAWLTGTDAALFTPLLGIAEGVRAGGGQLVAEPDFPAPDPAFLL